jgi:hypothetical protein
MRAVSSPEQSRLPDEVQQLADDLNRALVADGWRVEVRPAARTNHFDVALSHPLVPGEHVFQYEGATIVEKARNWVQNWSEIQLVQDAPVRPEKHGLLRGLRAAASWPHGDGAPDAVRSVGYLLFEEGHLNEAEARWLDSAVEPDRSTDPRFGRA